MGFKIGLDKGTQFNTSAKMGEEDTKHKPIRKSRVRGGMQPSSYSRQGLSVAEPFSDHHYTSIRNVFLQFNNHK